MSDYGKAAALPLQVGGLGCLLLSAGLASARAHAAERATADTLAAWDAYYARQARRQAAEVLRAADTEMATARADYELDLARRRYRASATRAS